jgi:hypothetical protein
MFDSKWWSDTLAKTLRSYLLAKTLRYLFSGFGWLGAALIIYGVIAEVTGDKWSPLEHIAEPLSSALTILGTVVVALSVYFFGTSAAAAPEAVLKFVLSPLIILLSFAALIALLLIGRLPIVVVNGFAILGLAGALLRIQPDPDVQRISN